MYLNLEKLFKLTETYLNNYPCDDLNQVIHQDFTCENINNMLSIYGLNPNSFSSISNKSMESQFNYILLDWII